MRRIPLAVIAIAAFAVSAAAQTSSKDSQQKNTPQNQNAPAVQAQAGASASAGASLSGQAGSSPQQPQPANQPRDKQASASASGASATNASASAGGASISLASDTQVQAELLTALDARHAKPGQRVVARTTRDVKQNGHTVLRKGTRLIGHVTEASARTKGNAQSALGIAFDHALPRGGQEEPLQLSIHALAAAANQISTDSAIASGDDSMGAVAGPGGLPRGDGGLLYQGGAGGAVTGVARGAGDVAGDASGTVAGSAGAAGNAGRVANGTANAATSAAGSAIANRGGLNAAGQLAAGSQGVFGLPGLTLASASGAAAQGSVVMSKTGNVHLDSGTQLLLAASKQ